MSNATHPTLSVVVPVFNEAGSLQQFQASLLLVLDDALRNDYEIIYCDDGSDDESADIIGELARKDKHIKLIKLSRNFGKENALSAGIAAAQGRAVLMLDSDGQHPVELIPKFLEEWKQGNQVVIGVRKNTVGVGSVKKIMSRAFYRIFNSLTGQTLIPGSTDFRLIDRAVQQAFLRMPETDRITRGLIDWLGFKRTFISFEAKARIHGEASYSFRQLVRLAAHSFVSLSPKPLYMFGYLGMIITMLAFILGSTVFIEQLLLGDPLSWEFTGTAMLGIVILFLVGIVLLSQGMLSLYISHIHSQTKQRPLYVIDYENSVGYKDEHDV